MDRVLFDWMHQEIMKNSDMHDIETVNRVIGDWGEIRIGKNTERSAMPYRVRFKLKEHKKDLFSSSALDEEDACRVSYWKLKWYVLGVVAEIEEKITDTLSV